MRTNLGYRLVGCSAFVAVCAACHAQILVSGNPNLYKSDYVENFEEFAPEGSVSVSPNQTVGSLIGTPIFGGNAAISLTNPGPVGTGGDGTYLSAYSPVDYVPPVGQTAAPIWGIGEAGYAGTYNNSRQGLGFGTTTNPDPLDEYLSTVTISLQPGLNETYFGGYFQSAFMPQPYPNDGLISFTFFNGSTPVGTLLEATNSGPDFLTDQPLVGMAFTFKSGSFTSVQISGDFVAMDSLRVAATAQVVPEPAPFAVMGLGLGALALMRRRRR